MANGANSEVKAAEAIEAMQATVHLLEIRESMQKLFGDEYPGRVAQMKPFVTAEMEKHKCTAITAAINIVTDLQREFPNSEGVSQALILSAAVELIDEQPHTEEKTEP